MESDRERHLLLSSLIRIEHGKLIDYVLPVRPAAEATPYLFAHLLAWNEKNGRIRDTKIAYPVIALRTSAMADQELAENAVAHLAVQGPRELVRGYRFSAELSAARQTIRHGRRAMFQEAIRSYLRAREADERWWDAAVVRSRAAMRTLYAVSHLPPSDRARMILFEKCYPIGSVFAIIRDLANLPPLEAAAAILKYKIPIQVAAGAGVKLDDPNVLIALVQAMSGNELVQAAKQFGKLKSFQVGAVQDAYREAAGKIAKDKKVSVGKVKRAQEAAPEAARALASIKERAAESVAKVRGDWLILADRSGSMKQSIAVARELAALVAHRVEGKVYLVFFNTTPLLFEATGKKLEDIQVETRHVRADGGTSIGCGLRLIRDRKLSVDGIVIVSDGAENSAPYFVMEYGALENEPSVYFVKLRGGLNNTPTDALERTMATAGVVHQVFDGTRGFDHYAQENVVALLKPGTYGLLDEVMSTPLLKLADVFGKSRRLDAVVS